MGRRPSMCAAIRSAASTERSKSMSLLSKKISENVTKVIRVLPVRPTGPTGRYSAAQLQAFFDQAAESIRVYFNALIDELRGENAASEIGFNPTEYVDARNVQSAIEDVQRQAANAAMGEIPAGAVGTNHLGAGAVTAEKIDPEIWGWKKVDAEDLYLDTTAPGTVYGNSIRITAQNFWYAPMLQMIFWNVVAVAEVAQDGIAQDGVAFMPKLHGYSKYMPRLDTGMSSIEYFGSSDGALEGASIRRDRSGNGSYLLAFSKQSRSGELARMSGLYLCVGE